MGLKYGGPGVSPTNKLGFGNRISLAAGETWLISPAGSYWVLPGPYTALQIYDPILTSWVSVGGMGAGNAEPIYIDSDGVSYRLANLTGQPVGALVTAAGTGFTSAPSVTIASGNSIWRPVLGSYVASVTMTNLGTNYTYAPTVLFSSPPAGGIPATGIAVLSGSTVASVTMINKGAGYTSVPQVTFVNDPREGQNSVVQGYSAAGTAVLAGSGGVNAVICTDPGNTTYTATTTFTTSGGGGSGLTVTPIFCLSITGVSSVSGGPLYSASGYAEFTGVDIATNTISAPLNPSVSNGIIATGTSAGGLVKVRKASILVQTTTSSALTSVGAVVYDGGIYTAFTPIPQLLTVPVATAVATTVAVTFAMGGVSDTSYISS
jgi:hypothetical protein